MRPVWNGGDARYTLQIDVVDRWRDGFLGSCRGSLRQDECHRGTDGALIVLQGQEAALNASNVGRVMVPCDEAQYWIANSCCKRSVYDETW